ncbi:hypothetical protein [Vibrio phage phiKT1028]|nr:hypothetical protein [Vibrio phage phiKT1028]
MLVNFLSFGSIPELHDRHPLVTSPIGEPTGSELTFSKDPNHYPSKDGTTILINFYSRDSEEVEVFIDQAMIDRQNEISVWLLDQGKRGNLTADASSCLQQLRATFTLDIEIVSVGEMVTNGAIYLPSFVEMKFTTEEDVVTARIWYATGYFTAEYPFREILVALPLPPEDMDYLINHNHLEIQERLMKETPDIIQERINDLTGDQKYPYTARKPVKFEFIDTTNGQTVPIYFTAIIYGNASDVDEQLYETIKEEILKNSNFDETTWEPHLPDLFNPLEFTCVPYWNTVGMINETKAASSFSPIGDFEQMLELPTKYCPTINSQDLIKSLQTVPFMYNNTLVAFVAKTKNYGGKIKIREIYPDYQILSADDYDNGRLELDTFYFIRQMEGLLAAGEIVKPDGIPPAGVKRLERNGILYVTKRIGKVNYLCPTYWQMVQDGVINE